MNISEILFLPVFPGDIHTHNTPTHAQKPILMKFKKIEQDEKQNIPEYKNSVITVPNIFSNKLLLVLKIQEQFLIV